MSRTVLLTGACGFLGSHVATAWSRQFPADRLVVLDSLTYAGSRDNLAGVPHTFVRGDIADPRAVARAFADRIDIVVHLAAETHVDRSIDEPTAFVRTNVLGTQVLLDAARERGAPRFVHISTDEVYGSLGDSDIPTREDGPFRPSSPYAASKVGAEALVAAAHRTYGQDTVIARPANCFGLRQFPEKLIPVLLRAALAGAPLPLYGDGLYRRDWLAATEFADAILLLAERGSAGSAYNIPGSGERTNRDVAEAVCRATRVGSERIVSMRDRPGHDRRYATDGAQIRSLGFAPRLVLEDVLPALVTEALEKHRT